MVGIVDRWGDPTNYVSFYRPPGWQDKWNAMITQIDDKKRLAQLKELLAILYEEAIGMPYMADSPLLARQKKLHGFDFHANHIVNYYEPQNIWMSK
jgi:hypothetical protein